MSGTGHSIKSMSPSGNQLIDGQQSGLGWNDSLVTYSFPLSGSQYNYGNERISFGRVSSLQQTAARFALDKADGNSANDGFSVEGFTDQTIVLTSASNAHVRLGESDAPYTAWAYYPATGNWGGASGSATPSIIARRSPATTNGRRFCTRSVMPSA